MTNRVLFAGGEQDSIVVLTGSATDNTSGNHDSTYSRSSLAVSATGSVKCAFMDSSMVATTVASGSTLWVRVYMHPGGSFVTSAGTSLTINDSSGFPWVALRSTSPSGSFGAYGNTNTGASPTWTQIGSGVGGSQNYWDIKVAINSGGSHTVEFYVGSVLVTSGTFTNASFTNAADFRLFGLVSTYTLYWSQMMATEGWSTVGGHVFTKVASGAGSNSGMTGAYTDVNESGAVNDTTLLSAASTGLKSTFAMADVTVPAGSVIKGVWSTARFKNDGSSPLNLKQVIRSSGTDYDNAVTHSGAGGFAGYLTRWDVDPATSADWTQSGWNAAELGVKSA